MSLWPASAYRLRRLGDPERQHRPPQPVRTAVVQGFDFDVLNGPVEAGSAGTASAILVADPNGLSRSIMARETVGTLDPGGAA